MAGTACPKHIGVLEIEALLEEVSNGIDFMGATRDAIESESTDSPPLSYLPKKSWDDGMSTISDNVMLRIVATSMGRKDEFAPRKCRIHCKNYFEHMCPDYNRDITNARNITLHEHWREPLRKYFSGEDGGYLYSANNVHQMLVETKKLLENNSRPLLPPK